MIGVNLIPEKEVVTRRKKRRLAAWGFILAVACTVSAVPAAIEVARHQKVKTYYKLRSRVAEKIDRAKSCLNALKVDIRMLEAQAARSEALRAKRPWARLLGMISRSIPEEIWLTSIATTPATSPPGDRDLTKRTKPGQPEQAGSGVVVLDAPRALTIEGYATEHQDLYVFINDLQATGAFRTVSLIHASNQLVFDASAVQFKIVCQW